MLLQVTKANNATYLIGSSYLVARSLNFSTLLFLFVGTFFHLTVLPFRMFMCSFWSSNLVGRIKKIITIKAKAKSAIDSMHLRWGPSHHFGSSNGNGIHCRRVITKVTWWILLVELHKWATCGPTGEEGIGCHGGPGVHQASCKLNNKSNVYSN